MVELADVDGNRSANDADRLAIARASFMVTPFTSAATAEEKRTADMDHNGVVTVSDYLFAARVVISDLSPTTLDTAAQLHRRPHRLRRELRGRA